MHVYHKRHDDFIKQHQTTYCTLNIDEHSLPKDTCSNVHCQQFTDTIYPKTAYKQKFLPQRKQRSQSTLVSSTEQVINSKSSSEQQQRKYSFELHSDQLQTFERPLQTFERHFNSNSKPLESSSFRIDGTDYLQIYKQLETPIVFKNNKNQLLDQDEKLFQHKICTPSNKSNQNMLVPLENRHQDNFDIDLDDIDPIETFYQDTAFYCLSKKSTIRSLAIRLTIWPYFERLTMTVILLNCITLGLYDPMDTECRSQKCHVLEGLETFIFSYFLFEMLVKMLAFGIFGKLGYLAESWNRLDFFIVAAGTFELAYGDGEFLSSVRAVRVLRPLRAINRVPSIRILVTLLLDTLPMLGNVFLLCVLILMVFAIIGVQLWQGILRNRCFLDLPQNASSYIKNNSITLNRYYENDEENFICSSALNNGEVKCVYPLIEHYVSPNLTKCNLSFDQYVFGGGNVSGQCIDWNSYYTKCMPLGKNPFYGAISFDNAGEAFIAIFQAITLEGWADIMYYLQDAYSSWVWIYFVTLIVFGSYFLTNLCLVVVATQFSETRQRESALMEAARKRATSSTILTSSVNSVSKGCYNQILSLLRYYIRKGIRRLRRKFATYKAKKQMRKYSGRNRNGDIDAAAVHFHHHHHHHIHHHHLHLCPSATEQTNNNSRRSHNPAIENNPCGNEIAKTNDVLPDSTSSNIIQPLPSITIDEIDGDILKPLKALPMNTTTALIIPDTTVVICPPHGSYDSKRQSATLSFIPSVSNYRNDESYRSAGDASLSELDLSEEELQRLEKEVCPNGCSQYGGSSDEDCRRRRRRKAKETKCSKAKLKVKGWCETNWFKTAIMCAIFLNTVTMAIEHHQQPRKLTMTLDIFNAMFTTLFTIEFVMKFYGYGFYGYIKDAFNVFDATIVIISLVELVGSEQGGVSVLRTFRLMRIFKLVRFLPTLQKQIQVMLETLDSVMTFLGLLTIFIFTSSILGMHLFGGKLVFDGESVRHNFDNLMWSLITVFQVLTQEDWNSVLYDAMRATTKWASVYFVVLMIIGNYILFNLLVAILVEGFSTETDGILSSPIKSPTQEEKENAQMNGNMYLSPYDMRGINSSSSMPNIKSDHMYDIQCEDMRRAASETAMDKKKETAKEDEDDSRDKNSKKKRFCSFASITNCCIFDLCNKRSNWTCYLISKDNRARKLSIDIINNPWFDNVILFFILLNCIIMAMERPNIEPGSLERKIIDYSNHVFTGVFTIEMIIKIFALGFYFGERTTYLKSNWNRIDFVLVIISLVDIFVTYVVQSESGVLGMLKVFRAFRTLRPLRVISRAPGLKIVVETLIASLAPIGNLLVVAMVFFTIFGILGVQLFKGKFYYCNVEDDEEIITKSDCLRYGHMWVNKKYNFDNLFQALFTLFVFATKDGWVSLMYDGIDAVAVDKQPKKNSNPWAFLYFVSFLLIAGFVVINMVVGVIIDNFQKCRVMVEEEYDGVLPNSDQSENEENNNVNNRNELTKNANEIKPASSTKITVDNATGGNTLEVANQKLRKYSDLSSTKDNDNASTNIHASYHSNMSQHSEKNYELPENLNQYSTFRRCVFTVVSHYKFDLFIAVIIGLNVLFMAIEFYQMPADLIFFLKITNYVFTAIFIMEAIFKIYGFGLRLFFAQRWNQLDVVIVFLSIIGIVFEELNSSLPINPTIIRIMRVLRIARVLKILKAADGIQRLLNCVTEAIPQVGNLSMLFLLIFFIFSALGIELFGHLDCSLDECYGINRHAHFKNFGYALLTLFRISTGDNWSGILKDAINPKLCKDPCTMMPYVAPVYFAVFVLASQFVLVNVVVAVLMKQLEDAKTVFSVGDQSEANNELSEFGPESDFDKLKLLELDQLSLAEREPLLVASRKGNFSAPNTTDEKSPEHYKRYLQLSMRRPTSSYSDSISLNSISNPSLSSINDTEKYSNDTEKCNNDTEKYNNDIEKYSNDTEKYNNDKDKYNNDTEKYSDDTEKYSNDTENSGDDNNNGDNDRTTSLNVGDNTNESNKHEHSPSHANVMPSHSDAISDNECPEYHLNENQKTDNLDDNHLKIDNNIKIDSPNSNETLEILNDENTKTLESSPDLESDIGLESSPGSINSGFSRTNEEPLNKDNSDTSQNDDPTSQDKEPIDLTTNITPDNKMPEKQTPSSEKQTDSGSDGKPVADQNNVSENPVKDDDDLQESNV